VPDVSRLIWIACGVLLGIGLWKTGIAMLAGMTRPQPEPPPPGEMRKVNMRYRCTVCGLEIKLTLAPDEDPPPPKHCLEDMEVVAPLYD
jgi:hypothetical protein